MPGKTKNVQPDAEEFELGLDVDPSNVNPLTTWQIKRTPMSGTITVRLDDSALESIRTIADQQGILPTQLLRIWIMQRLVLEMRAGALTKESATSLPADTERKLRQETLRLLFERGHELVHGLVVNLADRIEAEAELRAELIAREEVGPE